MDKNKNTSIRTGGSLTWEELAKQDNVLNRYGHWGATGARTWKEGYLSYLGRGRRCTEPEV